MGDVAQILAGSVRSSQAGAPSSAATSDAGISAATNISTTTSTTNSNNNNTSTNNTIAPPPPPPISHYPSRSMKMSGMSREVMELMSGKQDKKSAALPPIVPSLSGGVGGVKALTMPPSTNTAGDIGTTTTTTTTTKPVVDTTVKIGNRFVSSAKPARSWVWAPFASSARTDGAMFKHWVRAGVEYPDYPYARFDIHLDAITYTEDEYVKLLQSPTWTKSETDFLMELVRKYELRWVIIHDRWKETFFSSSITSSANSTSRSSGSEGGDTSSNTTTKNQNSSSIDGGQRNIEDLQYRYYHVAALLAQNHIAQEAAAEVKALVSKAPPAVDTEEQKALAETIVLEQAAARAMAPPDPKNQPLIPTIGTGTTNKDVFDYQKEKERRAHMELVWNRTKEEELEEAELRKELRLVEAQLRKLKKSGGHILAAATAAGGPGGAGAPGTAGGGPGGMGGSGPPSRSVSRSVTPVPNAAGGAGAAAGGVAGMGGPAGAGGGMTGIPAGAVMVSDSHLLDQCFASTAPTPMPQTPYLQSGRLVPPSTGGQVGLNKTTLKRMDEVLEQQLNIPQRPIPTKRVCDLYDSVRKDVLTLLTLQKMVLQKEGQLQSKRLRLSKLSGGKNSSAATAAMLSEEMLLGVAPAPPPAPAPSSSGGGSSGRSKSGGGGKSKSKGGGKSKSKSSSSAAGADGGGAGGDGDTTATTTTKKKKTVKRKKKSSSSSGKDKDGTKSSSGGGKSPTPATGGAASASGQKTTSGSSKSSTKSSTTKNTDDGDDGKPSKKRAKKS